MIKKIIILALLAGVGYVGYLVWGNLTPREKAVVTKKASSVVNDAKNLAGKAADKLTGVARGEIKKIDSKDKKNRQTDKTTDPGALKQTDKKVESQEPGTE